ncbi:MAG: DNA internalization-related competence protein ComEC/Rec2 [Rhodocyclaceae bacterium]|jgi:competence protein ComEC|nr:DNA internalization-related competence protein ComEC/Rec2 [Rhodocyclaceae bacterium]
MQIAIIGFALGCLWVQNLADLPGVHLLVGILVLGILGNGLVAWLGQRAGWLQLTLLLVSLAAGWGAGAGWAGLRAEWRLADALPSNLEGQDLSVTGVVNELPQAVDNGVRFAFRVESASAPVPSRVLLGWYAGRGEEGAGMGPQVHAGERWRFTVRLKRPHGHANPGGFDMEAWLLERQLRATGYVRHGESAQRLGWARDPGSLVEGLRESSRGRIFAILGDRPAAGVLVALAVGDQRAMDGDLWQLFNRTGVQHLMAISGLHVGMVGMLAGWLAGLGWRRVPGLALRLATPKVSLVFGVLAASAYGALAGMGVPTQRTLLMLAVVALAHLAGRRVGGGRVLALALLVVLLADPWAVLAAGFWLSFGAVAVLLLAGSGRLRSDGPAKGFLRAQVAVGIGLLPLLLALFQQFSLVSPLANGVAIPLVSLLITPLVLLFLVLPFPPLLALAAWLTEGLISGLGWLAATPLVVWQQAAPPWPLLLASLLGAFWLLLPRGTPGRWAGLVPLALLLVWLPPRSAPGEWRMTVLDVGQGLALHVQTARHDLLFDTGPAWSREANNGQRVVLPFLRAIGVRGLDLLVVSHDDRDHSGGAASILTGLPVAQWASPLPAGHPLRALSVPHRPCLDGDEWTWDGVRFAMVHPPPGQGGADNAHSCALRIASPAGSALLLADLASSQEWEMVARHGARLASDVLVAPHHGSRSSSSPALTATVQPREVIYPVGYRNAFHHPHPEVVARWEALGARSWRTDLGGAVMVEAAGNGLRLHTHRQGRPRYWHGR